MRINGIVRRNRVWSLIINLVICLAFFCASISTVSAQASAQSQPGSQPGQKKDFLWSVKTANATVYLLGSFHLLQADAYPLDANIETAYKNSARVCFEMDIGAAKDPAYQSQLLAQGLYPEGQTLQQNISAETYALLDKKAAALGITTAQLNPLKPWLCAVTLSGLELLRRGFDPQYGIDQYFFAKAKKDNKPMFFFESLDFQMRLFTELTGKEGDALLRQTLKDLDVIETMLPDMVNAWKIGDAPRLGAFMTMSFKDLPDLYNRFVVQRNKAWVSTIERLLAQGGTSFVVVGAGHLGGPDNLLQLLQNKGYKIEQISAAR
jgi:uncharacterized protein YbaP (TraB family)